MYSRESYVNHRTSHHDYYVQFVGPEEMDKVVDVIGHQRILSSTDYHFNDIPDDEWDCLGIAPTYLERAPSGRRQPLGPWPSLRVQGRCPADPHDARPDIPVGGRSPPPRWATHPGHLPGHRGRVVSAPRRRTHPAP